MFPLDDGLDYSDPFAGLTDTQNTTVTMPDTFGMNPIVPDNFGLEDTNVGTGQTSGPIIPDNFGFETATPIQPDPPQPSKPSPIMPAPISEGFIADVLKDLIPEKVWNKLATGQGDLSFIDVIPKWHILPTAALGESIAGAALSKLIPKGIGLAATGVGGADKFSHVLAAQKEAVFGLLTKQFTRGHENESWSDAAKRGVADRMSGFDLMDQLFGKPESWGKDSAGTPFTGQVSRVIDGDTFEVIGPDGKPQRIRFHNLNTQESKLIQGQNATTFLKNILSPTVTITPMGKDPYGRVLGDVTDNNGKSINQQIIDAGLSPEIKFQRTRFEHDPLLVPKYIAYGAGAILAEVGLDPVTYETMGYEKLKLGEKIMGGIVEPGASKVFRELFDKGGLLDEAISKIENVKVQGKMRDAASFFNLLKDDPWRILRQTQIERARQEGAAQLGTVSRYKPVFDKLKEAADKYGLDETELKKQFFATELAAMDETVAPEDRLKVFAETVMMNGYRTGNAESKIVANSTPPGWEFTQQYDELANGFFKKKSMVGERTIPFEETVQEPFTHTRQVPIAGNEAQPASKPPSFPEFVRQRKNERDNFIKEIIPIIKSEANASEEGNGQYVVEAFNKAKNFNDLRGLVYKHSAYLSRKQQKMLYDLTAKATEENARTVYPSFVENFVPKAPEQKFETITEQGFRTVTRTRAKTVTEEYSDPHSDLFPDKPELLPVSRIDRPVPGVKPEDAGIIGSIYYSLGHEPVGQVPEGAIFMKTNKTPVNPLLLYRNGKLGRNSSYPAIEAMLGKDEADRLDGMMSQNLDGLIAEAKNLGMTDAQVKAIKRVGRPTAFMDYIANEVARKKNYDAIVWKRPSDGGGEYVALDAAKSLGEDVANYIYKPSVVKEILEAGLMVKDQEAVRRAASEAKGFFEPELQDDRLDYLPRRMTSELRAWMVDQGLKNGQVVTPEDFHFTKSNELARNWKGIPVNTIQELGQSGRIGEISPMLEGYVGKIFEDDPAKILLRREFESLAKQADMFVVDDMIQSMGKHVDVAPEGYKLLRASLVDPESSAGRRLSPILAKIKDMALPESVADEINKLTIFNADPTAKKEVGDMLGDFYRTLTKNFAAAALSSPKTLSRNALGMPWNAWVARIRPDKWAKWFHVADQLLKDKVDNITIGTQQFTRDEIMRYAELHGTAASITGGDYLSDLFFGKPVAFHRLPVVGKATKWMARQFVRMEQTGRFGQMLAHVEQQVEEKPNILPDFWRASQKVWDSQFDYANISLSPFEQWLRKWVMPFYVWNRRNIPFQIKGLVRNPTPFVRLSQAYELMPDFFGLKQRDKNNMAEEEGLLEEWAKQMSVPTSKTPDGKLSVFLLGSWVPAGDLEAVFRPDSLQARLLGQVAGPLKAAIGLFANRNIDTPGAQNIEDPAWTDTQRFLGYNGFRQLGLPALPKRLQFVVESIIPPLAAMDKAINAFYDPNLHGQLGRKFRNSMGEMLKWMLGGTTEVDLGNAEKQQMKKIQKLMLENKAAMFQGDEEKYKATWEELIDEYKKFGGSQ